MNENYDFVNEIYVNGPEKGGFVIRFTKVEEDSLSDERKRIWNDFITPAYDLLDEVKFYKENFLRSEKFSNYEDAFKYAKNYIDCNIEGYNCAFISFDGNNGHTPILITTVTARMIGRLKDKENKEELNHIKKLALSIEKEEQYAKLKEEKLKAKQREDLLKILEGNIEDLRKQQCEIE